MKSVRTATRQSFEIHMMMGVDVKAAPCNSFLKNSRGTGKMSWMKKRRAATGRM
jgi:hypothetical protein